LILFLVWPNSERDKNILLPIVGILEKKHKVEIGSIFNAFFLIALHRPEMIVVANFAGSVVNHIVCKFAFKMGIKTVSLVSEGVIPKGIESALFWGANKEKELYIDRYLLWNEEMHEAFIHIEGQYKDRFRVVGATGFDRYLVQTPNELKEAIKARRDSYERVITYASWAFDLFEDAPYFRQYEKEIIPHYPMDQVIRFREDKKMLSNILFDFIKNHPTDLFILKYHPGTLYADKTELGDRFKSLENVLIYNPEEKIDLKDLIEVSDLWLAYESTTAMEAWLMNKTTIFINPSNEKFKRSEVHKGTLIIKDMAELEQAYVELVKENKIEAFEDLNEERKRILKALIGFSDGQSSVRAAEEIDNLFEEKIVREKNKNFFIPLHFILKITLKYYLSFIIKKYSYMHGEIIKNNRENLS
jgi:surface carbohydrate biosynthesis protein